MNAPTGRTYTPRDILSIARAQLREIADAAEELNDHHDMLDRDDMDSRLDWLMHATRDLETDIIATMRQEP